MWDRGHRDQCEVELAYVDEKFSKSTTFLGFFTRSVMRVVILWLILDWISIHKKVLALMRGLHKPLAKRGWFISIWVNLLLLYFLSVSSFLSSSHISIIFFSLSSLSSDFIFNGNSSHVQNFLRSRIDCFSLLSSFFYNLMTKKNFFSFMSVWIFNVIADTSCQVHSIIDFSSFFALCGCS